MRTELRKTFAIMVVFAAAVLIACHFPVTFWPLEPTGSVHPIGNSGGEFQQYSLPVTPPPTPYFHRGIDILGAAAPSGSFVVTTRAGVPTLTLTGASSTQNGATLHHADGSTYLYWHLDFNSITQAARDADTNQTTLAANNRVARLHIWPACSYHHLHYEVGDATGNEDPVWSLSPRNDATAPVIQDVFFVQNATNIQFPTEPPGRSVVQGNVDIIAQAYDSQFGTARTGVMYIRYRVSDATGAPVKAGITVGFIRIPAVSQVSVIYRNSSPFDSNSDYCQTENYYYAVTNVDASGNFVEAFTWDTTSHPNGIYSVEVQAWDAWFNTSASIKQVRLAN